MKRLFHISALLIMLMPAMASAQNQAELRLTQLINLPDTAFEGVAYNNITAIVANVSNIPFQGSLSIAYSSDSTNTVGLIYYNGAGTYIPPGSSATFVINNFLFNPSHFRSADNIVVVWPTGNFRVTDSLTTYVYFVPVSAVGTPEFYSEQIQLWPNPSVDRISFNFPKKWTPEHVRIISSLGQVVLNENWAGEQIELKAIKKGAYLIELRFRNGLIVRKKLLHSPK